MADTVTERLMPFSKPLGASMTDTSKTAINDLIGGEGLQLVESNTMREAASLISALEAERDTWKDLALKKEAFILSKAQDIEAAEAQVATLQAKLEKAAEALEPFAEAITRYDAKWDEETGGQDREGDGETVEYLGWLGDYFELVTLGDFRHAASTLSTLREAGNDQT